MEKENKELEWQAEEILEANEEVTFFDENIELKLTLSYDKEKQEYFLTAFCNWVNERLQTNKFISSYEEQIKWVVIKWVDIEWIKEILSTYSWNTPITFILWEIKAIHKERINNYYNEKRRLKKEEREKKKKERVETELEKLLREDEERKEKIKFLKRQKKLLDWEEEKED